MSAVGSPPLTYQWYRDGVALTDDGQVSGSSSTNLVLADITPTEEGDYSVVIANGCGAITNMPVPITTFGPAVPRILNPRVAGDQFQFSFSTEAGARYLAEFSDDPSLPLWFPLELLEGNGTVHDAVDPSQFVSSRFYRVRLLAP